MGGRQGPAGGASLLVSGAMENYLYRTDPWFGFDGGPNPSYGGTAYFSNRGPSAMGRHYLDALTSGMFGYGADPLNDNPFIGDSGAVQDGNSSWILWSGTSLSTPNLAGITALVYDAYAAAHGGTFPLAPTAKSIVKQSADDAGQDPTLTGTGIANAFRAVLIANLTDGLSIDVDEWNPGDYHGVVYPSYANILPAGGADMATITLTNNRATSMDVTIEDAVLAQTGSVEFSFTRIPGTGADEYLFNATGFMATNGTLLVPGNATLWGTADSIRVSAFIGRQRMIDDIPASRLRISDWTDVDANGSYDGFGERNLITQNFISWVSINGPYTYMFLHNLDTMVHDGVVLRLDSFLDPADPITVTYVVDYFERTDWPWLSSSAGMVTIPGGLSTTVDLMVTVPADAKPGLYEAMYLFTLDNGNVTTLPVMVNVASDGILMEFGASSPGDSGHYQQGVTYGEWWGDDATASGDYRYYMLDLPEPATVTVIVGWNSPLSVHGLLILTNLTDWFSENFGARYGPGTQDTVASTDVELLTTNGTAITASLNRGLNIIVLKAFHVESMSVGESPKGQVGVIDVSPPDLIGVGVPVDGTETFTITSDFEFLDVSLSVATGEILVFLDQPVDPYPFPGGDFATYLFNAPNILETVIAAGTQRASWVLFFHSGASDVDMGIFYDANCDGIYAVADEVTGLSASTGANPETFSTLNPAAGCYWVHAAGFTVDPGSLYDLTFGVITTPFIFPVDVPSTIPAGVPTDVTIAYSLPLIAGNAFGGDIAIGSPQFPRAIVIPVDLTPDLPPLFANQAPRDITVPTAHPTLSVDMTDFPDAFEGIIDVASVEVFLDGADVTVFADITPTSVTLPLPFVIAEGRHDVTVTAADLTGSASSTSWSFDVDTITPIIVITSPEGPLTNDPDVVIAGLADPTATLTVDGTEVFVSFIGKFTTTLTLPEGAHSIDVVSTDTAGNSATVTVKIEVDLTAPALTLSSPADGSTVEVASVEVTGSTEAGASVSVNGIVVDVDANGAFSFSLALAPGSNTITAVATDLAGNSGSTSVSVTFNDPVPGLQQDLNNANDGLNIAQGNVAGLQTQVLIAIIIAVSGVVLAGVVFWRGMGKGQ
jgi:hypothetical protein